MSRPHVAYYRVSTARQGRSGLGLEGQQIPVRRFLANAEPPIAEFTEVESGRKNHRPKLLEALRWCRVYSATLVIANLDRLSRNVALISSLMESRVEFVVADFPEANRFTLHILAAVAEYETKLISDRLKAAFAAAKSRGVKLGEQLKGSRTRRPEDLAAARAAQIGRMRDRAFALRPLLRDLRDDGRSLSGIAAELTRLEIETPRNGLRWKPESLRCQFRLCGLELPLKSRRGRSRRPTQRAGAVIAG
jgi:DNA invertase Pin-like site-specific DNA recombinase